VDKIKGNIIDFYRNIKYKMMKSAFLSLYFPIQGRLDPIIALNYTKRVSSRTRDGRRASLSFRTHPKIPDLKETDVD